MKKFVLYIMFAVTLISSSAFATENANVNYNIQQAFEREFKGAKSVQWENLSTKEIFRATFTFNNERFHAYFLTDGTLLATGRFIRNENVPMLVSRALNDRFSKYDVKETIEMVTGAETRYVLRLENEKQVVTIQADLDGSTLVLKKEKKNSLSKL
ncbi:MAG: hypothetical protein H7Y31_03695 [Chitinophagaceae bacterium]|nr:hypothetical protein [Chitinophagaceae bacterium]